MTAVGSQLGLGLPLELGIADFHADDGGQSFPDVVAGQRLGILFQKVVGVRIVIDRASQGRLEADEVRPAFFGIDIVGE